MSLLSVKVSQRYQIAVPTSARKRLNIQKGDRLLVDIQDGMLILLPQPKNYAQAMSGLHSDIWQGVDAQHCVNEERGAWGTSSRD